MLVKHQPHFVSAYLDSYLDVIGRTAGIEDWQLKQLIHALRILFLDML